MTPADFYPGHSPRGRLPVKGPLPLLGRSSHFRGPPPAEGAAAGDRRPGEPASHRPSGLHWRFHARAGTRGPQRPPQGTGPPRASSRAISRCQLANDRCPGRGLGPAIRPTPCHPSQAANWQKGLGRKKRAGAGPSRKEKTSSCVSPGRAHPFAPRPRPFREWLRRELQRAGTGNTPSGPWWRPRGASPLQAPGLAGDDDGEVCFAQI